MLGKKYFNVKSWILKMDMELITEISKEIPVIALVKAFIISIHMDHRANHDNKTAT